MRAGSEACLKIARGRRVEVSETKRSARGDTAVLGSDRLRPCDGATIAAVAVLVPWFSESSWDQRPIIGGQRSRPACGRRVQGVGPSRLKVGIRALICRSRRPRDGATIRHLPGPAECRMQHPAQAKRTGQCCCWWMNRIGERMQTEQRSGATEQR